MTKIIERLRRAILNDDDKIWMNNPSIKKHQKIHPYATYSPWLDDHEFMLIYDTISAQNTLVDMYRCYDLWYLVKQASLVEGDILEVGVWRGGTGALLAYAARHMTEKLVYLADTFSGVVKAGDKDTVYNGGEHSDTTIDAVQDLLARMSLTNTEILHGIFPDETAERVRSDIAFLHCDVDVYSSAKDTTEWCLPRMHAGSMLVFDDFGFSGCEGVTEFCEELRANTDLRFVYNLNGHAIFIKTSKP
jgi:O-methyltransferase